MCMSSQDHELTILQASDDGYRRVLCDCLGDLATALSELQARRVCALLAKHLDDAGCRQAQHCGIWTEDRIDKRESQELNEIRRRTRALSRKWSIIRGSKIITNRRWR
jgi:hypothetical protein